jgi:hypothetical protein
MSHKVDGVLPHAYLFTGPRYVGKMMVARTFIQHLLCEKGQTSKKILDACGVCNKCVAFLRDAHPDVQLVKSGNDKEHISIGIDDIRDFKSRIFRTSLMGGYKIGVIDDVSFLTREAGNALLKIVEEPPPRTVLILLAHDAGHILHTLESRAVCMKFWPLSSKRIESVLVSSGMDKKRAAEISMLSLGFPGLALTMIDETQKQIDEHMSELQNLGKELFVPCAGERAHIVTRMVEDRDYALSRYTRSIALLRTLLHAQCGWVSDMSVPLGASNISPLVTAEYIADMTQMFSRASLPYVHTGLAYESILMGPRTL